MLILLLSPLPRSQVRQGLWAELAGLRSPGVRVSPTFLGSLASPQRFRPEASRPCPFVSWEAVYSFKNGLEGEDSAFFWSPC